MGISLLRTTFFGTFFLFYSDIPIHNECEGCRSILYVLPAVKLQKQAYKVLTTKPNIFSKKAMHCAMEKKVFKDLLLCILQTSFNSRPFNWVFFKVFLVHIKFFKVFLVQTKCLILIMYQGYSKCIRFSITSILSGILVLLCILLFLGVTRKFFYDLWPFSGWQILMWGL